MMMKKIIIIGNGGHANSLLDVIKNIKSLKFSGFVAQHKDSKTVFGRLRSQKDSQKDQVCSNRGWTD